MKLIKQEGEPFNCHTELKLLRWCILRFMWSCLTEWRWLIPRGYAYQWRDQVWTCYMRIRVPWQNVDRKFEFEHNHDAYYDPFSDPETGKEHMHPFGGGYDPWTRKYETAESTKCWCFEKRKVNA